MGWAYYALQVMAGAFALFLGVLFLVVLLLFAIDHAQTGDAIRRNYPVIGRFRGLFTTLGEFFRQYFFAMDREEMPFNRAQRNWVYNAAEAKGNTVAFGSTRNLNIPGTPIFMNAVFPPLDDQYASTEPMVVGPYCREPYMAPSIFNISGMSYGAISKPAVRALSRGARRAGIWLNTGEGGLAPYHLEGGCDIVFQIGTAKFGVRDAAGNLSDDKLREVARRPEVKMFEIKLSQGAKPGKGVAWSEGWAGDWAATAISAWATTRGGMTEPAPPITGNAGLSRSCPGVCDDAADRALPEPVVRTTPCKMRFLPRIPHGFWGQVRG